MSDLDEQYSEGPNLRPRNLRTRPQRRGGAGGESNFDGNSDDGTKQRKGKKKGYFYGKNSAYDEYGNIKYNGLDVCDCMSEKCDGCWYPCVQCNSTKCGPQCRTNRKFFYERIEHDGKDLIVYNKQFQNIK